MEKLKKHQLKMKKQRKMNMLDGKTKIYQLNMKKQRKLNMLDGEIEQIPTEHEETKKNEHVGWRN